MAKTVKMCDLMGETAARVFVMLNPGKVRIHKHTYTDGNVSIVTDVEPKDLTYPEGWYYAKGYFTNKHNSTTGMYSAIVMFNENYDIWDVPYCTD